MKNRVRVSRAEQNLSQAELASRIGVSRQTINSIENGRYVPSTMLALKIANTFDRPVEDLFQLEDTDWGSS